MVFPAERAGPSGGELIGQGIMGYFRSLDEEKQREKDLAVINDPQSSSMQRAMALERVSPETAKAYMQQQNLLVKEQAKQQRQRDMSSDLADLINKHRTQGINPQQDVRKQSYPQAGVQQQPERFIPGISPLHEQMQQQQAIPQEEAFDEQETVTPEGVVDEEEMQTLYDKIPESELQKFMMQYPEAAPAIKEELATRRNREGLKQKDRLAKEKAEREDFKAVSGYVDKTVDAYRGKKEQDATLNRMESLLNKRNLTTPAMATLLSKLKLNVGILGNPDSEEFEKLSNSLTRNITKFYGSRILQTEFNNFLKQIPSLMNSDEGKKIIIDNMRKLSMPQELEYKIMNEIIDENDGKPPLNLKLQVSRRMEKVLDQWANEFKDQFGESEIMMTPDGRKIRVPAGKVEEAKSMGAKIA